MHKYVIGKQSAEALQSFSGGYEGQSIIDVYTDYYAYSQYVGGKNVTDVDDGLVTAVGPDCWSSIFCNFGQTYTYIAFRW